MADKRGKRAPRVSQVSFKPKVRLDPARTRGMDNSRVSRPVAIPPAAAWWTRGSRRDRHWATYSGVVHSPGPGRVESYFRFEANLADTRGSLAPLVSHRALLVLLSRIIYGTGCSRC